MKLIFILYKKYFKILTIAALMVVCVSITTISGYRYVTAHTEVGKEIEDVLEDCFRQRDAALVTGNSSYIRGQFDTSSTYGKWSYEHELGRIKYIKEWSNARKVKFKDCESKLKIFSIRPGKNSVRVYMSVRTKLSYVYTDKPWDLNEFCLGTRHTINLVNKQGTWYVTVDWYSDPLEDSGVAGTFMSTSEQNTEVLAYAAGRYNRAKAVEYADRYCGALWDREDGYKYNTKYRNYADLGGDCANFASQVLADKSAGNLRMDGTWLYKRGSASRAWVNASSFTRYIMYSGKGRLIARGKYNKVAGLTKNLSPGDIVAYERKGDIVHVSVVTAKDSNGMLLVNSHTNDRYHVPWDLGWDSTVSFWLLKITG